MNRVILGGYLGQDPELKFTNGGQAVLKLRLATNSRVKNSASGEWENMTEWHTVVMWGKRGESLSKFISKGSYLMVEGENRTRSWQDKDGGKRSATEVIAKDIETTGRAPGGQRGDYEEDQSAGQRSPRKAKFVPEDDESFGPDVTQGFG
jgi:single-strand DNA-binding protein